MLAREKYYIYYNKFNFAEQKRKNSAPIGSNFKLNKKSTIGNCWYYLYAPMGIQLNF